LDSEDVMAILGHEGETYDLYEPGEEALRAFLADINKCGGIAQESGC
jgi:hypothetical protein